MPDNGALLSAGLTAGSEVANALLTGARNKKQYERSINFWRMQNIYNSPEEQMKRFQRAGLNPNLIYGNGATTVASAPDNAPIETPRLDLGRVGSSYFNIAQQRLQTDNLKMQNTLMQEEALLKRAQTRATLANAGLTEFNLGYKGDMRQTSVDYARELLRGKYLSNENLNLNNEFLANTYHNRVVGTRLTNDLRSAQIKNIETNVLSQQERIKLMQFEQRLNESGVTRQDEIYWRMLSTWLNNFGINLGNYGKGK